MTPKAHVLDEYIAAIDRGEWELDLCARPLRTAICHRAGWEDMIVRTSRAQSPGRKHFTPARKQQPTPF